MKLSMVAPELRGATRRMSMPLPVRSKLGRRIVRKLIRLAPKVRQDDVDILWPDDAAPAHLCVYVPKRRTSRGALLWIHGGGYVIGDIAQDARFCIDTARQLGVAVIAAGYRLAPEHPFPAPLDDCHAAWTWLLRNADALDIDPDTIAIGGQSAGGGLAAGLVQRIHDSGPGKAAAQWLFCPMIDDRTARRRELDAIRHRVWSNRLNAFGWRAFLGAAPGAATLPPYAAAARRTDLAGLPRAWIGVGDIDLFLDEDRAYAGRLRAAGVDVVFDVVPGAPHGFEAWAAETEIAKEFVGRAREWLRGALDTAR